MQYFLKYYGERLAFIAMLHRDASIARDSKEMSPETILYFKLTKLCRSVSLIKNC